jgi:hypothetical protein
MKLSPETKHALIIGGGLVVAVVLGIIVFKKYQGNSQAGQAASDQADQDELAYLESMALQGDSEYAGGSSGSSITLPSASSGTSLAEEIQQIEQAFGLAPSSGSSSGSGGSGSSSSGSSSSGSGSTPTKTPAPHHLPTTPTPSGLDDPRESEYVL